MASVRNGLIFCAIALLVLSISADPVEVHYNEAKEKVVGITDAAIDRANAAAGKVVDFTNNMIDRVGDATVRMGEFVTEDIPSAIQHAGNHIANAGNSVHAWTMCNVGVEEYCA